VETKHGNDRSKIQNTGSGANSELTDEQCGLFLRLARKRRGERLNIIDAESAEHTEDKTPLCIFASDALGILLGADVASAK
jgi:hypothetical protein